MAELYVYIIGLTLGITAIIYYVFLASTPEPPQKRIRRRWNAELVTVLLGLEEEDLEELFRLYREQFGQSAARYAHQTYRKWKAGEVRPNRQTFNRLLVHLPKVMSFDLKCEVLRRVMEAYCPKDDHKLTVYTDDWKESLAPLVETVIKKAYTAALPKPVEERLRWLSENETQFARQLLAESQTRQSVNALAMLQGEIDGIEMLLLDAKGTKRVTHTLRLPYGTITLNIKRR